MGGEGFRYEEEGLWMLPVTGEGPESGGTMVKLSDGGPSDPVKPAEAMGSEGGKNGWEVVPNAEGSKPGLGFKQPEMKPRVPEE